MTSSQARRRSLLETWTVLPMEKNFARNMRYAYQLREVSFDSWATFKTRFILTLHDSLHSSSSHYLVLVRFEATPQSSTFPTATPPDKTIKEDVTLIP